MSALRRFWHWLRNPQYETPKGFVTIETVEVVRIQWYQLGLAEGELRGRQALATELESQFPPDGRHPFTHDDAKRTKQRQVH